MPMIEVDNPATLMRARDGIAALAKIDREWLAEHHALTLGWINALHVEGLTSAEMAQQLYRELEAAYGARKAEL